MRCDASPFGVDGALGWVWAALLLVAVAIGAAVVS